MPPRAVRKGTVRKPTKDNVVVTAENTDAGINININNDNEELIKEKVKKIHKRDKADIAQYLNNVIELKQLGYDFKILDYEKFLNNILQIIESSDVVSKNIERYQINELSQLKRFDKSHDILVYNSFKIFTDSFDTLQTYKILKTRIHFISSYCLQCLLTYMYKKKLIKLCDADMIIRSKNNCLEIEEILNHESANKYEILFFSSVFRPIFLDYLKDQQDNIDNSKKITGQLTLLLEKYILCAMNIEYISCDVIENIKTLLTHGVTMNLDILYKIHMLLNTIIKQYSRRYISGNEGRHCDYYESLYIDVMKNGSSYSLYNWFTKFSKKERGYLYLNAKALPVMIIKTGLYESETCINFLQTELFKNTKNQPNLRLVSIIGSIKIITVLFAKCIHENNDINQIVGKMFDLYLSYCKFINNNNNNINNNNNVARYYGHNIDYSNDPTINNLIDIEINGLVDQLIEKYELENYIINKTNKTKKMNKYELNILKILKEKKDNIVLSDTLTIFCKHGFFDHMYTLINEYKVYPTVQHLNSLALYFKDYSSIIGTNVFIHNIFTYFSIILNKKNYSYEPNNVNNVKKKVLTPKNIDVIDVTSKLGTHSLYGTTISKLRTFMQTTVIPNLSNDMRTIMDHHNGSTFDNECANLIDMNNDEYVKAIEFMLNFKLTPNIDTIKNLLTSNNEKSEASNNNFGPDNVENINVIQQIYGQGFEDVKNYHKYYESLMEIASLNLIKHLGLMALYKEMKANTDVINNNGETNNNNEIDADADTDADADADADTDTDADNTTENIIEEPDTDTDVKVIDMDQKKAGRYGLNRNRNNRGNIHSNVNYDYRYKYLLLNHMYKSKNYDTSFNKKYDKDKINFMMKGELLNHVIKIFISRNLDIDKNICKILLTCPFIDNHIFAKGFQQSIFDEELYYECYKNNTLYFYKNLFTESKFTLRNLCINKKSKDIIQYCKFNNITLDNYCYVLASQSKNIDLIKYLLSKNYEVPILCLCTIINDYKTTGKIDKEMTRNISKKYDTQEYLMQTL